MKSSRQRKGIEEQKGKEEEWIVIFRGNINVIFR